MSKSIVHISAFMHESGLHILECKGMGIMGKCLATILSLAVTVFSKLRFENSLELAYT